MHWTTTLAVWTLVVWGGRIRNIVADDSLTTSDLAWRLSLAMGFVALASVTLVALWRSRSLSTSPPGRLVLALAACTAAVWLSRGGGIVFDASHEMGFKVVHTVLAAVSITLAWLAAREVQPSSTSRARVKQRQPPPAFKNSETSHTSTS